ncbi:MAG TPA: metal-dependent hydrolase [Taishania sp.]|nr:metal-dependent hydrolase [Taishania sp.]HNS41474.1 metal-dependent hydrolase [Taishania sp.]
MKISYYGHSSLGLEINGKHILVDPFISQNPKAANIAIDSLKADYVLLTHAHYDHIMDVEAIVERTKAKIISNHEIVTYYANNKQFEGHAMNQGGSWNFDFGRVKVVNAIHSSSFPDGTYGGNPVGFVISAEGKNIYIAGDTALTMDMKLIPLFFKLELAILPIGGNFTMDIEEAIVAAQFVECDTIMGMHYDTAPYIEINHQEAHDKFKAINKNLLLLNIGESYEL